MLIFPRHLKTYLAAPRAAADRGGAGGPLFPLPRRQCYIIGRRVSEDRKTRIALGRHRFPEPMSRLRPGSSTAHYHDLDGA